MDTVNVMKYRCSICRTMFDTAEEALQCEERPLSMDKGVKIGDKVNVTRGSGAGHTATVEDVYPIDRTWGHVLWNRYWHTVGITVKLDDLPGHRFLTFDDYTIFS